MKKDTMRVLLVTVILLVLYHLVVFLIPFDRSENFWAAYGFTLAAFAVGGWAVYDGVVKGDSARSKFYGFPLAKLGAIYLVCQLAVGLLAMILTDLIPVWIEILIYALGMGAALIGLVSADATREHIEQLDVQLKKDVSLMRCLQSKVNQIVSSCEDVEALAAVKAFSEELRYSDPVSNEAIAYAEADLAAAVSELEQAVVDGEPQAICGQCRKATAALAERNRLCKLHKHG